jgi:hypothetical protein
MEYKIIEVKENTKLTGNEIGTEPVEFKFISGHGEQVKDILDQELAIQKKNELFDRQQLEIKEGTEIPENELVKNRVLPQVKLNLKALSFEDRLEILRSALNNQDLLDSTLVLNIFNLINSYKELNKDYYSSEEVMVNSTIEFIDMKNKLKEELTKFSNELARYYISIIKTVGVTDFPANNLPQPIPYVYQRILLISDFISMSNIIKSIQEVNGLIYVENAELFLSALANRYVFANAMIKDLELLKKD